ncbi:Small nuclear ribonucleoprotein-associated protein B [Gnomoniopsis sp. IMI 355080]|nr:Small nuclear ribonucleoprotein-associated protein B [Gnomoniopsis sp. IMI 355080]
MANKQGKMAGYINYRMRVTLLDGRQMTGQMLAFDKHMNVVLADTEEFRKTKKQSKPAAPGAGASAAQTVVQEEKRTLGLTIVRGKNIVSLSVESPPPADPSARLGKSTTGGISSTLTGGPGVARPAGRGAAPPVALTGPAPGVGGVPPPSFPGFPGGPPGFPGRGGAPPGFPGGPGGFPPAGFPGAPPGGAFPPGFPVPGGQPPAGFNPPPRR